MRRLVRRGGDGPWSVVAGTAGAKVAVMALSGLLGILTSRLIILHFGTGAYAQYGLISSLPSLLPFADLGIGAAIINVIAGSSSPSTDVHVRRTLTSALRILVASGGVVAGIAVLLHVLDLWPTLLGDGLLPGGGLVATACMVLWGLAMPLTVGQRTLVGLGKNPTQIATQALVAPFIMAAIGLTVLVGVSDGNELAVYSYVAAALVSLLCIALAARQVRPQIGQALRDVPRVRSVPGVNVRDVALPMLIQMIALPLAMQTDRLLLSHLATTRELAQYNLGSQFFGIVLQTVSAGGVALWPYFARARSRGAVRSPFAVTGVFVLVAASLAGALCVLLPWLVDFVADGRITLDRPIVLGFVAFVVVQAAKYPLGMYMTDVRGLRFQVPPILLMVPLNIGLSWWWVGELGAAGPILGSAVSVLLCQVLPNAWYVRRDLARRRREALEPAPEPARP